MAIDFRFLAGRYHATAWDHHVNEGLVEWPPSPWRILRALVAASYKLVPVASPEEVRRALQPLVSLPSYHLPATEQAHTRHYMPVCGDSPDKIFDAFAAVGDGVLTASWPDAELEPAQAELLDRILDVLGYLGRSESWVEARRLDRIADQPNLTPVAGERRMDDQHLAALVPPDDYATWREAYLPVALPRGGKGARPPVPADDWWGALHIDTQRLFQETWSSVPGMRQVPYRLTRDLVAHPPRRRPVQERPSPTVARFALSSAVLPRIEQVTSVADRARRALLSWSDGLSVFSGRDAGGNRAEGHGHAFYLPADEDGDGRIDHLVVWSRDGFEPQAVTALERVRRLWGASGHDIHLALVGLGTSADYGVRQPGGSPILRRARAWASATPFVRPRHTKWRRGRLVDGPEEQLVRCLEQMDLPAPRLITAVGAPATGRAIPWHRFRTVRPSGGGSIGSLRGLGFRLDFERPVDGPVAVGYGAHHGLGQFIALDGG